MSELNKVQAMAVRFFARAILHGDKDHRRWLIDAAEEFIDTGDVTTVTTNG